jgi:hypothetical protein
VRRRFPLLLAALTSLSLSVYANSADDRDPAKDKSRPVEVTVDTSEAPEVADWAGKAKKLIEKWHPKIAEYLKTPGFTPSSKVKLTFKNPMNGIAYTTGSEIYVSADWIKKHPEDTGMVVHELVHVIQRYSKDPPGWLVEGIADYIRCYQYEPQTRLPAVRPTPKGYRQGYKTTAQFLAWIERTHDKDIVKQLNQALRQGDYTDELFTKETGQTLDQLWTAFLRSGAARGRAESRARKSA